MINLFKNKLFEDSINKDVYFEINHDDNKIIFNLKNHTLLSKYYLIIKHRKSQKRIIKKFNKNKVEIYFSEIFEFNEIGFFDFYIKINLHNKKYTKRIPFKPQNDLILSDLNHQRILKFYNTINGNLSLEYIENIVRITSKYDVTAIVLVYNGEPYLNKCLNSLVNQTLKNLEILLINDASTDNSLKICAQYEKKYDNVRLINKKENKGLSHSANLGIKLAKGKYITLVDNDDIVPCYAYEKLYNKAIETDADVSLGKANFINKYQSEMNYLDIVPWNEERIVTDLNEFPQLFYDVFYWNKLIKKELILKNNIEMPMEIKIYADRCFTHKVYSVANKISIIPDCVYLWRKRDDSLSRIRWNIDNFNDRINSYEYDLDSLSDFYPNYFNTLFRRALIPIKGILDNDEFEKLFFERILKLFNIGQSKVNNIYNNNFDEITNIYSFLILNGFFDELKKLLQLDLKNESEILNENGKSYWKLPQFRNPNLNIPDELFEIKYMQEQFIKIDEINITEDYIFIKNIKIPEFFELSEAQIIFKGRAKSNEIYDEVCFNFKLENNGKGRFNAKISILQLSPFEKYIVTLRFENKFGYYKDIKLSTKNIKKISNSNENINILISSNNHLLIINQFLKDIFELKYDDDKLIFNVNSSNLKKNFKIYLQDNESKKKIYFDFDSINLEYSLKWKFFLEQNSFYNIFLRVYDDAGKLNNIVKMNCDYIKNFDDALVNTNENINVKIYSSEENVLKINSIN